MIHILHTLWLCPCSTLSKLWISWYVIYSFKYYFLFYHTFIISLNYFRSIIAIFIEKLSNETTTIIQEETVVLSCTYLLFHFHSSYHGSMNFLIQTLHEFSRTNFPAELSICPQYKNNYWLRLILKLIAATTRS